MNLLNITQLSEKLGMKSNSLTQLRRREASFPPPIYVSPKILRWDETDIEKWLTTKKEIANDERVGT